MRRISISSMLGFVAVIAIGLAALIHASEVWTAIAFNLTMATLLGSVVGLVLRAERKGGWLGFALFGWGYFLVGFITVLGFYTYAWFLPDTASTWIFIKTNPYPVKPPNLYDYVPGTSDFTPPAKAFWEAKRDFDGRFSNATMIGRWLWVLLFGGVGSLLGNLLAIGRRRPAALTIPDNSPVT